MTPGSWSINTPAPSPLRWEHSECSTLNPSISLGNQLQLLPVVIRSITFSWFYSLPRHPYPLCCQSFLHLSYKLPALHPSSQGFLLGNPHEDPFTESTIWGNSVGFSILCTHTHTHKEKAENKYQER